MKAIIRYYPESDVPVNMQDITSLSILDFSIHGAPHNRQHRAVLQKYREELLDIANRRIGHLIHLPIAHPIFLKVLFTNPNTPDLDHSLTALYQALDGKTLKGPSILEDDRWIQGVLINKFYPNPPTKRDGTR